MSIAAPFAYAPAAVPLALVTHAHSRAAVAGVRALGAANVNVIALADRRGAAGLWSRHATRRAVGPPSDRPEQWRSAIAALAGRHGPLVVYPGQEEGIGALAGVDGAILPYPSVEVVDALRDKRRLADLSRDAGIASPAVLAEGAAAEVARDVPDAPTVLKSPGLSDALPVALMCSTGADLRAALESLPPTEPVIVQERADGPLLAVSVVLDRDGTIVARFQQAALRLWPTTAGASSLGRSVAPNEDLVEQVAALLRSAGYWGLAQVQLVGTARGPAAIDVNPRFYGSLPLATAAGVNLPLAWHQVATGERPRPQLDYRAGVTYRWLEGELTAVWNGERHRLRVRAPRPRAGAMWAWDDPAASVVLAAEAAAPRVRRLTGRLSR
jgi:predicted ATP-grasp superfamily ATP-dependent carboligase